MAALTMAMTGQDVDRRSAISARYGTTPHFDLLQGFAQRHRIPLKPGFARRRPASSPDGIRTRDLLLERTCQREEVQDEQKKRIIQE